MNSVYSWVLTALRDGYVSTLYSSGWASKVLVPLRWAFFAVGSLSEVELELGAVDASLSEPLSLSLKLSSDWKSFSKLRNLGEGRLGAS